MKVIKSIGKEIGHSKSVKVMKDFKKKVTKTKAASQKFLIDAGIFTKKGKLKKQYRNLKIS